MPESRFPGGPKLVDITRELRVCKTVWDQVSQFTDKGSPGETQDKVRDLPDLLPHVLGHILQQFPMRSRRQNGSSTNEPPREENSPTALIDRGQRKNLAIRILASPCWWTIRKKTLFNSLPNRPDRFRWYSGEVRSDFVQDVVGKIGEVDRRIPSCQGGGVGNMRSTSDFRIWWLHRSGGVGRG